MNHRKNLWIAIVIMVVSVIGLSVLGKSGSYTVFCLLGLFIILPVFASIYAVKTLRKERYLSWFFLSLILPLVVPLILALQKPVIQPAFSPETIIGGSRADSYGLGEPVRFYFTKVYSYIGYQIAAVVAAIMIGPLLSLPFMSRETSEQSVLGVTVPFIAVIGLSVLFIRQIKKAEIRSSKICVAQYKDGLVYVDRNNLPEIIKWDCVSKVWQDFMDQYFNGIRTHHRRRCKLEIKNSDRCFEFTEKLEGIETLTDVVHQSVTPFLIKEMAADLKAGREINFGKISLNEKGIFLKRNHLAWDEVAGIYLDRGYVVIARLSHSKGAAKFSNSLSNISALATSFIGTAQPFSMGGETTVWKKTGVKGTPNPYTLTQLVLNILKRD